MLALSLQQKRITRNSDPCTSLAECLDDYLQMNTKTTSTQASKPNDSRAHLLGLFQRWAEMKERNLSALSYTDKMLVFKITIFAISRKE